GGKTEVAEGQGSPGMISCCLAHCCSPVPRLTHRLPQYGGGEIARMRGGENIKASMTVRAGLTPGWGLIAPIIKPMLTPMNALGSPAGGGYWNRLLARVLNLAKEADVMFGQAMCASTFPQRRATQHCNWR